MSRRSTSSSAYPVPAFLAVAVRTGLPLVGCALTVVAWSGTASAQICFGPDRGIPAPGGQSITSADFDGDGDIDIATPSDGAQIQLWRNDGRGGFSGPTPVPVAGPGSIASADLDGDGDSDLVGAGDSPGSPGSLSVALNMGGGIFAAYTSYPAPSASRVLCADLDGDGDIDLAAATSSQGRVHVLANLGNGTFAPAVTYVAHAGPEQIEKLAVGDLDGDGDLDIVTANYILGSISVLVNAGNGTFGAPTVYGGLPGYARSVACADLDSDGDVDLAVSVYPTRLAVFTNPGGGTFPVAPALYDAGDRPLGIRAADFDSDGDLDLVVANRNEATATVLANEGGVFVAGTTLVMTTGTTCWAVDVADYDGDGAVDVAALGTGLGLFLSCSTGRPFCLGDGSGAACPCGNVSTPAGYAQGCRSTLGYGAELRASGDASLSADSLVLAGGAMPNGPALYLQGTTREAAGAGTAFGDGLRCVGGSIVRLGTKTNVAGSSQDPAGAELPVSVRGQVQAPGIRTYQVWYRNAAPFCTSAPFNLSNGWEILWTP